MEENNSFSIDHKVSIEALTELHPDLAGKISGLLFCIQRLPLSEVKGVMENADGNLILQTDEYGYLFRWATGVEFDISDTYGLSETEYHMLASRRLAQAIMDSIYLLE